MSTVGIVSNMNFPAPVAVLGFLAAVAGVVLSTLAALTLLFVGKARWALRVGALVGAGAVVYIALLLGMSLASREVTLAPGQEKYFCEIDCHLAYSVVATREELESGQRQLHVTLRTRFDENTISPQRPKDAPLAPNPRHVLLLDSRGRSFRHDWDPADAESDPGRVVRDPTHIPRPGRCHPATVTTREPRLGRAFLDRQRGQPRTQENLFCSPR